MQSIALIIVNWNSGRLLDSCLDAVAKQTLLPSRTIVVDNASTDSSLAECERKWPDVEVIRLNENTGFAAGNNLAFKRAAEYEWVVLLNPDAIPEVDWLEKLYQAALDNTDYVSFGSRQLQFENPKLLDGVGDVYHVSGGHWRSGHDRAITASDHSNREIFSPCAAAAMYRSDVFREMGGFDESFFCYAEDVDLGFRLRLRGYRCLYVAGAVVTHVGSASSGKLSDFTIYHGHRNLVWVYFKNMPSLLLWIYLPHHIFLNLYTLLTFTLRGRARIIFRAKWDALMGLPRVIKQRRAIQASCRVGNFSLRSQMSTGLIAPYMRHFRRILSRSG